MRVTIVRIAENLAFSLVMYGIAWFLLRKKEGKVIDFNNVLHAFGIICSALVPTILFQLQAAVVRGDYRYGLILPGLQLGFSLVFIATLRSQISKATVVVGSIAFVLILALSAQSIIPQGEVPFGQGHEIEIAAPSAPPAVNQAASQPIPAPSTIRRDDPPPDPADVVWDKPAATPASQAGAKQDKYRRIAAGDLSALPDKYRRIAAGDDYIDPAEVEIDGSFIDPAEVLIDSKPAAGNAGRVTSGGGGGVQVSPEAQNIQGQAYYEAQNFAEAVKWWRMAAENGYARAQTNLGISYVTGKGVPKNATEAAKWYRLAAVQGNAQAQYNLGVMYDDGDGVPQDTTEAVRLFRKAAEQGNVNAQFNLGMMFDNGKGIAKNRAEAVKWYRMAAAQGDTDAKRNLNVLLSR